MQACDQLRAMISRSPRWTAATGGNAPPPRRSGIDGRRRIERAAAAAAGNRDADANAADALEWLAQAAVGFRDQERAGRAPGPRTAIPRRCRCRRRRDRAAATAQGRGCSSTTAIAPGALGVVRLHPDQHAKIGGDRQVDRHLDPAHAPDAARRARGGARPRAPAHPRRGRASSKRSGRAKGSSRSCTARPRRRGPAGCCLTPQRLLSPPGMPRLVSPRRSFPRSLTQTCRKHVGIRLMFLVNLAVSAR